jgi:hypothetical protein
MVPFQPEIVILKKTAFWVVVPASFRPGTVCFGSGFGQELFLFWPGTVVKIQNPQKLSFAARKEFFRLIFSDIWIALNI